MGEEKPRNSGRVKDLVEKLERGEITSKDALNPSSLAMMLPILLPIILSAYVPF